MTNENGRYLLINVNFVNVPRNQLIGVDGPLFSTLSWTVTPMNFFSTAPKYLNFDCPDSIRDIIFV